MLKRKQSYLLLTLVFLLLFAIPAEASTIRVNGEVVELDQAPIKENGRILVPMRPVLEALDAYVQWLPTGQGVYTKKDNTEIYLFPEQHYAFVNYEPVYLDAPAKIVNGRTMVPLRFVMEGLGATVDYDYATGDVDIYQAKNDKTVTTLATTHNPDDVATLARLIASEAPGEPYDGKIAVAAVVMNRVNDSRFPSSIKDVVYQPNQFTVINNGQYYSRNITAEDLTAAVAALEGEDPSNGALFFFNPRRTSDSFLHSRTPIIDIGNHRFTR